MQEYQILPDISLRWCVAVGAVPHSKGLFVLLVEGPDNDHEHRTDSTLQKTEKEALSIEVLVVPADDRQDQTDAPEGYNTRCDTLDGKALSQEHGRIGSDNESKVEDGRRHRVSVTCSQVKIIAEPKQSLHSGQADSHMRGVDDLLLAKAWPCRSIEDRK